MLSCGLKQILVLDDESAIWNEIGGSRTSDAVKSQAWPKDDPILFAAICGLIAALHDAITMRRMVVNYCHLPEKPKIIRWITDPPRFYGIWRTPTMMLKRAMNFLQRIKKPVVTSQETPVKITMPPVKKPVRRDVADSDGKLRRLRQLVEHNRLI